jgi:hypothetical protein
MAATTLTALKAVKQQLLLKPLDAAIFLAPWYTAPPAAFTDSASLLQTLPVQYLPVGLISKKDGINFARSVDTSNLDSYGELEATRMDITGDSTTISFTPQQTSRLTLELTHNVDLSAVNANASSGEVFFAQPTAPQIRYYSAIVIGKDGSDAAPIYIYKVLPKVAVSKFDGETWDKDGSLSQKLTMTAFKDNTAGFAVGHGFGGLGWKNLLGDVGFAPVVKTATIGGTPTGGTFTITVDGQTTTNLAYNATTAVVQTAIQALASVGAGNCTVTGTAGTSYVMTFTRSVTVVGASGALLTPSGTVTIS